MAAELYDLSARPKKSRLLCRLSKVELFYLNENAAKQLHLHLDPCKVTQPSHELYAM